MFSNLSQNINMRRVSFFHPTTILSRTYTRLRLRRFLLLRRRRLGQRSVAAAGRSGAGGLQAHDVAGVVHGRHYDATTNWWWACAGRVDRLISSAICHCSADQILVVSWAGSPFRGRVRWWSLEQLRAFKLPRRELRVRLVSRFVGGEEEYRRARHVRVLENFGRNAAQLCRGRERACVWNGGIIEGRGKSTESRTKDVGESDMDRPTTPTAVYHV